MSIESMNSDSLPRIDSSEQNRTQAQQTQAQEANELNPRTIDSVREAIREQRTENSEQREMSQDELLKTAEQFVEVAQTLNRELQFSVNKDIDETVITVIDRNTGETVRQIPSEEIVRLAERVRELSASQGQSTQPEIDSATGFLVDSLV
ncbi:flagellar protein FlaG [Aliidiomarina soli]|uniref:Flagellar biosynthesis protein FlaG n=1 Tax=Aliidiomarina soli TaxID=1928574 RepID=A0A432WCW4_9GAMM|nr:flagellar protein FlaG [Aliidiomarina soli]RUO30234.1 hypothetical protein CWE14_12705 [Aliidiomarina soli]